MKWLVLALLAGCHAAPAWNGVRPGMTIADVETTLRGRGDDVLRPALENPESEPRLNVDLPDGSHATVAFRPGGAWKFIAVRSQNLSLDDARALRARIADQRGPPKHKTINLRAEWPDGVIFIAREKRDGVLGTVEARVGQTGPVPIGPAGLSWGMSPKAVRIALENNADAEDEDEELEFGTDRSWLAATFQNARLHRVAYWHIPSLGADAAEARLRVLQNELGPANLVEDSDDWDWPAQKLTVQIQQVRGQSTAIVHQVYFD